MHAYKHIPLQQKKALLRTINIAKYPYSAVLYSLTLGYYNTNYYPQIQLLLTTTNHLLRNLEGE